MTSKGWTRRQVLRGAGVALALPWLETLAPRTAQAQAAAVRRRLVTMYFSNGTAAFWTPTGGGSGASWTLSPIMEPLTALKAKVLAMSNVSNTTPYISAKDPDGTHPQGSHGALSASTWTAAPANGPNNGISIDQVVANTIAAGSNPTSVHSLQVGLSTVDSFTDGLAAQHSRSMSWKSPSEPLYKTVNPQAVFDLLVAARGAIPSAPSAMTNVAPAPDPAAERRRALKKSSLDYITESSTTLKGKLSASDAIRMDQFLTSVRSLESRIMQSATLPQAPATCKSTVRPPFSVSVGVLPANYSRATHADLMTDLIMMALQCDITRVVSHMLDDARSEFVYKFLQQRNFTATGSTLGTGGCDQYHAMQHAGETNNQFATIGWWMAQKAADLAGKLAAVSEGPAGSMLENTVILLASGMHGSSHKGIDIPVAIIGNAGGVLKQDTYVPFAAGQQIANVHLTVMQKVFGAKETSFGSSTGIIPELLA
jgi:Protein of unknown function (DUF1552)